MDLQGSEPEGIRIAGHFDPETGRPVFDGVKNVPRGPASEKGYNQENNRLVKIAYSHEAMIDMIVAEPRITQTELASRFGYTKQWVCRVMGSDAFQAALAKRRQEITDPFLIASVEERFKGLAFQSMDILARKLEATDSADLALKVLDTSMRGSSFGARDRAPGGIINNFVVALPGKAADADTWAGKYAGTSIEAPSPARIDHLSTTTTLDPTIQPKSTEIAED